MSSKVGLDKFVVSCRVLQVIRFCRKEGIACYSVERKDDTTIFYTRIYDRKKVYAVFPNAQYLHTTGLLGMFYRNIKKPSRLLSYACMAILWAVLSNTVFKIEVIGEGDHVQKALQKTSQSYLYKIKETQQMKQQLLSDFQKDISWLEVYEQGSVVKVRFKQKEKIENKPIDNVPLIAKKEGLIAYFKCKSGYKVKHVNEVVKQGELLVNNTMPDSFGTNKEIKVEGKVYAYTWQKVSVEIEENKVPDAINYFSLLLKARDEIHIDIKEDEKVEKENVLQFSKNKGKIKLEILYTLLEDITS